MGRNDWDLSTKLNHPNHVSVPAGNVPLIAPIYQTAKFAPSADYPYSEQFMYSRASNPTTRQLENILAEVQKKEEAIVVSSGVAALTGTFLGLLSAGDHVVSFKELYRPARIFLRETLPKFGITSTFLSLKNCHDLEKAIIPGKTKLIHFESPTNPNLDVADIEHIITVAHAQGVLVSMDGTFAGLHQHTEFDVDLMIQSLTKFGNGHGDVIAGSIAGKKSVVTKLREMCINLGATLDPHAAYLIMRGLKTYDLRYERQSDTAMKLAQYLAKHPVVRAVRYPGLSDHPQHDLAKKQMKDMGAIIAFELHEKLGVLAQEFCHRLKLIQFTASVGSTETIICPTELFFGGDLSPEDRAQLGINPRTLRLSVGLESFEDLKTDLEQVLSPRHTL
jgi:cystathionine beta-lyase/cystathionine gamma-synthase